MILFWKSSVNLIVEDISKYYIDASSIKIQTRNGNSLVFTVNQRHVGGMRHEQSSED